MIIRTLARRLEQAGRRRAHVLTEGARRKRGINMKTLLRRLRKLEEKAAPRAFIEPAWIGILRERRRRRAEAAGEPYVEPLLREPMDPVLFANGRWPSWPC
jgi:hypothetical protein